MNWTRGACGFACLTVFFVFASENAGSERSAKTVSRHSESVIQLTEELSIRPTQTTTGADPLFRMEESCFSHAHLGNVAAVVPRMSSFLDVAPTSDIKTGPWSLNNSIPAAYREQGPASLCRYSLSSLNGGERTTAALLPEGLK